MLEATLIALVMIQTKHLAVDWVWQPAYECTNKGTYGHWGGVRHAGKNALGTGFCLGFAFGLNPLFALVLAALDFVIHYHIDWAKMNVNRMCRLEPGRPRFWWLLGFDQYLHQITYLGLIGYTLWHLQAL